MPLRIVGAGLGRTGTTSLTAALEQLLGGPVYHFEQLFERESDVAFWNRAIAGERPLDWRGFFAPFEANLDWPATAFWEEIAEAHPDALILLSTRESAEAWAKSYVRTIAPTLMYPASYKHPAMQVARDVSFATFTRDVGDVAAVAEAYEKHNAHVRATAPAERLVEWTTGDGWGPLCAALGIPEPANEFPHLNTADQFRTGNRIGSKAPFATRVTRRFKRMTRR